ncbi:unnamed protein product [Ascophyllum nodosum]
MIFEEIYTIDLYFHNHAYRNDSIRFVSKSRGQTLFLK